jgi:hypothetical protein
MVVDSETKNRLNVSYDYTVVDVQVVEQDSMKITQVWVKSKLVSNVEYTYLVAAGYTTIRSNWNNSFILDGDMTMFFKKGTLTKAKTDEDVEMTYSVKDVQYQTTFGNTYVTVAQDINSTATYNRLAPAWVGTEDGEVMWSIVDDLDSVTYDWDVYNDINYKLTVTH